MMFSTKNVPSQVMFVLLVLFMLMSALLPVNASHTNVTHNSDQPTPTPFVLPADAPGSAGNPVAHNTDWTPIEADFDGVTMALVPAGCFDMGSDTGKADELPINKQCFDAPFWIDKLEVKQSDFVRMGGTKESPNAFKGDNRPIELITWFEARQFCEDNRKMHLPTEAEWEYVVRGPDNLIYPWGDEWNKDNLVWAGNSGEQTSEVGSRPEGISWVGALDMSGNVMEWVSSLDMPYPFDATDGREAGTEAKPDIQRIVRGGSWDVTQKSLRAPARDRNYADSVYFNNGFRCAKSY